VARFLRKVPLAGTTVIDLARERIAHCYDLFDHVAVMMSGGKDSTVTMWVAVEVARALGRLPVRAVFWDEECIPAQTVEFMERIRTQHADEVTLEWLTVPTQYHNSCSVEEPSWWPWGPEFEDIWVRPRPAGTIEHLPGYPEHPKEKRLFHMGANAYLFDPKVHGSSVVLMGIRAAESLMRMSAILTRFAEPWLHEHDVNVKGTLVKAYPIYDWSTPDVWKAMGDFGWDYNEAYDRMAMVGIAPHYQRISSPFHVEALANLRIWAAAYPEVYDRMVARVPGAATAARYAGGDLFGFGRDVEPKPEGMAWREWVVDIIRRHPEARQRYIADHVAGYIASHFRKTSEPIVAQTKHPLTSVSWDYLARYAMRDDWINRKKPRLDRDQAARRRVAYDAELAAIRTGGRMWEIRP